MSLFIVFIFQQKYEFDRAEKNGNIVTEKNFDHVPAQKSDIVPFNSLQFANVVLVYCNDMFILKTHKSLSGIKKLVCKPCQTGFS